MTEITDKYRWDKDDGVCIGNKQQIQLCGGTKEFRKRCGRLLVDALNNGMTEERAREILGANIITPGGGIYRRAYEPFDRALEYRPGDSGIMLRGEFTADELEAIAFWMRKHNRGMRNEPSY